MSWINQLYYSYSYHQIGASTRGCLIVFIFICSFSVSAQFNRIYSESFDNNTNNWILDKNETFHSFIKDSKYHLQSFGFEKTCFFSQSIPLLDQFDYTITIIIHGSIVNTENRFGFFWGQRSTKTQQALVFSKKGVRFESKIKGYELLDQAWQKIKKPSSKTLPSHTVSIIKQADSLFISVDNQAVFKGKNRPLLGNRSGFFISGTQKVEIDLLQFEQEVDIRLDPDIDTSLIKINLGSSINSKHNELGPVIGNKGRTLFFTKSDNIQHRHDKRGKQKNNLIWQSYCDSTSHFSKAKVVGPPLNNKGHNSVISFSSDDRRIYLGNTYFEDGRPKGVGISTTPFSSSNAYSIPSNIQIKGLQNKGNVSSYHLSPNGQFLFLSMENPTMNGHSDMYISTRQDDYIFSKPVPIPSLNTIFDEGTPFLASDYRTLFFCSNGHPGYGSFDIFYSKRIGNDWKNWSEPVNLGPFINSMYWEGHYTESIDRNKKMIVSNHGVEHHGGDDIYLIEQKQQRLNSLFSNQILKRDSSLIASAEVLVFRDNGQLFDSTRVDKGFFSIALPKDENLSLFIHKNGYISKHLSVNDKTQQITSISLDSIVEYQFIQIPCSVLTHPIFKKEITGSLVNQLKKKIDTKLSINGPHLSSCQFIKEHFIQQGIAHQRLIIEDTNAVYCSLSVRTEHLLFKQTPIKLKKMKRLRNIQYDQRYLLQSFQYAADSFHLTKPMVSELNSLVNQMHDQQDLQIEIIGHTNTRPPHPYCDQLSMKRINEIQSYLTDNGIEANRLKLIPMGKRYPMYSEDRQAENQRVEVIFRNK